MNKLNTIDLFAGAGGMTEGFRQAGYQCLFANDFDDLVSATFRRNHPNTLVSAEPIEALNPIELMEHLGIEKGNLGVLIGGPPCQGFSTYGKRDPKDLRNQLYRQYLRFLDVFEPKSFVIENVVGILSMLDGKIIADILQHVKALGYAVCHGVVNAADYGVPQVRKRVIIIGTRTKLPIGHPAPTHREPTKGTAYQVSLFTEDELPAYINVRQAISDLPTQALPPEETMKSIPYPKANGLSAFQKDMRNGSGCIYHHASKRMMAIRKLRMKLLAQGDYGTAIRSRGISASLLSEMLKVLHSEDEYYCDLSQVRGEDKQKHELLVSALSRQRPHFGEIMELLDSGGFANKYRRLNWETPSHTLVAHMARDCSDFVHPEEDRFISVREAARLQTFPDKYIFEGSQFAQFKQIGNAVPPRLAKAIAGHIRGFLGN